MRKLKLSIGIIALVFVALSFTSCKDAKKENTNEDGHHTEAGHDNSDGHHDGDNTSASNTRDIEANDQKIETTSPIIDAYIQIKNGLVADSKENAAKGAGALLKAFSQFDMTALTGNIHNEYMEILESAKEHAEHIVKSPIDHQREHFEVLSTDINDSLQRFLPNGK